MNNIKHCSKRGHFWKRSILKKSLLRRVSSLQSVKMLHLIKVAVGNDNIVKETQVRTAA